MSTFEIIMRSILVFLYMVMIVNSIILNNLYAKDKQYKFIVILSICTALLSMCLLVQIFFLINACGVVIGL